MLRKFFDWSPCKRKKEKKENVPQTLSVLKPVSPPQSPEPPIFLNQTRFSTPDNPTDGAPSFANVPVPDASYHSPVPPISPPGLGDQPDDRSPTPRPPSPPLIMDAPQGILEGAMNFKIENSILTNVHGNAMIFKFEGGGPPNEEFNSIFTQHLAGLVTVEDFDRVEKRILTQAIRTLPRADAAYNDYTSRDRRRTTCFEGTRRALLEEMATWVINRDNSPVYLLFGPAGMGKSTVAHTIAARADNLRSLGASFFFSRDETERRNAKRFFTSIAFQLCVFDKEFAQAIGNALTEETGAAASSKEPLEQLKRLILEPLRPVVSKRSLHVLVIVDALDECEEEDGQLVLKGLDMLVKELRAFKVILTTRPQPHLQHLVKNLVAHKVFHLQNIEDKIVDGDIRLYLKYNLSLEQAGNQLPDLEPWSASDAEIDALVKAVGRLFIIASTAILFILDKAAYDPASQMEKLLNAFSHDRTPLNSLNNFYTVILRNAVPPDSDLDLVERYQVVIGTIITIQEPLPIEALTVLTGLSPKSIRAVLGNLQSVILFGNNNNVPRIYHKSFPDYITDPRRCKSKDLLIVPKDHHTRIATLCLRIMNKHLKRNILGLNGPTQYLNNDKALEEEAISENQIFEKIPEHLRYACAYWANHVQSGNAQDPELLKELKTFAEEHIVHWFETLSWIRRLDVAHHALTIILKLLRSTSEMRDIFSDALHFGPRFFGFIQESALHAYHSAISFTPTDSRLSQRYRKETVSSLCQVEGGLTEWDPVVAVLSEASQDNVTHILFSQDSTRVASWTYGTAKVWDAASGTPIRTFKGNNITFSSDLSIAALLHENKVTMHNVTNNAPIGTFDHATDVVELAVSFDGSRLAVGLSDGTVTLWDTGAEKVVAILENYTRNRDRADDEGSGEGDGEESDNNGDDDGGDGEDREDGEDGEDGEDHDAKNGENGEGHDGKNGEHDDADNGVDGEDDGGKSGERDDAENREDDEKSGEHDNTEDGEVDEENGENGEGEDGGGEGEEGEEEEEEEEEEEGSGGSNSDDETDETDNSEDESSEGSDGEQYFENLRTLAFSPTGDRLAFVSHDGISLWDSVSGEFAYNLNHDPDPVAGFVFSGDGSRLASLTYTHPSLRLWNSKNGELLGTTEGSGEALVVSADGSLLAAEEDKGKVQLWSGDPFSFLEILDVEVEVTSLALSNDLLAISSDDDDNVTLYDLKTRAQVAVFQIPDPTSLALSPDSTRIAVGNGWNEVHLLDVPSVRASFDTSHKDWHSIKAVAFSPDSSRLASGFADGTIELWVTSRPAHIIATHKIHTDEVTSLEFMPDGERFASVSGKSVLLWNGRDGSQIGPLGCAFTNRLIALACSSSLLAAATKDSIILWDHKSSQLIDALPQMKAKPISFSSDGSLLATADNHLLTCTVWDVEQRTPIAAFTMDSGIEKLIFSPDNSTLASWLEKGRLTLFDVVNDNIIDNLDHQDLGWIPHLNGIPIWYQIDEGYEISLVGHFSKHHERVPVLRIPRDVIWSSFSAGSSMFALGCVDGRVLFIRPPTN